MVKDVVEWFRGFMSKNITILVDNDSWILPYANQLREQLLQIDMSVTIARNHSDIKPGWICFLLGCTQLVPSKILKRNHHNLVVHESELPKGRGFAPMSWQILNGSNEITFCLVEAIEGADEGSILLKDLVVLDGTELCDEWRALQGLKTIEMCLRFVTEYESMKPTQQIGRPSYYARRTDLDSELDLNRTLKESFNLLRIVDNKRYPAFFKVNGKKYKVEISLIGNDEVGE